MENEKVFFIRHKHAEWTDTNGKDVKLENNFLKTNRRISIFYDNSPICSVINNSDYKGEQIEFNEEYFLNNGETKNYNQAYKSALGYMWWIGKHGGIVVAEYNNDAECLIGRAKALTPLEVFQGNDFKYEVTLRLDDVITLEYAKVPVLLAVRPPYGTICEPSTPFFKTIVPAILNNTIGEIEVTRKLLHPKMLEQLCLEYLRLVGVNNEKLDYCILRPGKSVSTIDIAGVSSKNRIIYAQVKTDKISDSAHKSFLDFIQCNEFGLNIIFCEDIRTLTKHDGIVYIDVDYVFDFFQGKNKDMIRNMIGFNL